MLSAALSLHLTLTVSTAPKFSIVTTGQPTRTNADNLVVKGFEKLHPIDRVRFDAHLEIPTTRGLGSSAAAYIAGLTAANEYARLGLTTSEVYSLAAELEGHPDNVAGALYGGIAVCGRDEKRALLPPRRLPVPRCVAPVLLIPSEPVRTAEARDLIPDMIALQEAVQNISATATLVAGLVQESPDTIAAGLVDWIHQERRAGLYPNSYAALNGAKSAGAIGATISGAGPSILFWCLPHTIERVVSELTTRHGAWAAVSAPAFAKAGVEILSASG